MFSTFYLPISEKRRTFALVIELERHIEILLLSNDCVIVPDLGGFMAHHVEARYDAEDGTFLPPLRTLGFNPQLKMNDSLLVQSYIEAYDISYPEALRRIEAEVAEIRQHLETDGQFELNDIGILRLNEEGHITFEPCEAGILTPNLYGLSSFEMSFIATKEEKEQITEQEKPAETILLNTVPEEESITIKMSWLRNIAAVAAAVVAFLMISSPISNSDINTQVQQSAFFPVGSLHTLTKAKADIKPLAAATDQVASADSASSNAEAASKEEVKPIASTYCIVLASQVNRQNAMDFIGQLNKQGYEEVRLLETKILRVVYGTYNSEDEAQNVLRTLRSQSKHFAEAWVMEVKQ
jgi:cell division septation protein DedD